MKSALGFPHVARWTYIMLYYARLFFMALVWLLSCRPEVCIVDHRRASYPVLYQAEGRTYIFGTAKLSADAAQPWPRIPQHKRGVQWRKVRNWNGIFDNDYMEFSHHRTSQQEEQNTIETHKNQFQLTNGIHISRSAYVVFRIPQSIAKLLHRLYDFPNPYW